MAGEIIYRVPVAEDAAAMAEVHLLSMRESYAAYVPAALLEALDPAEMTARWRGYIEAAQHPILLAEAKGRAAGIIRTGECREALTPRPDGHIYQLYVLDAFRRYGIGRGLAARAAGAYLSRSARSLSLGVLAANRPARGFYEALGARAAHPTVFPWGGHNLDAVIYVFDNLDELARFA